VGSAKALRPSSRMGATGACENRVRRCFLDDQRSMPGEHERALPSRVAPPRGRNTRELAPCAALRLHSLSHEQHAFVSRIKLYFSRITLPGRHQWGACPSNPGRAQNHHKRYSNHESDNQGFKGLRNKLAIVTFQVRVAFLGVTVDDFMERRASALYLCANVQHLSTSSSTFFVDVGEFTGNIHAN
jgi:hypothetical protein